MGAAGGQSAFDALVDDLCDAGFDPGVAAEIAELAVGLLGSGFTLEGASAIATALQASPGEVAPVLEAVAVLREAGAPDDDVVRMARAGQLAELPSALAAGVPVRAVLGLWRDAPPRLLEGMLRLGVRPEDLEAYAGVQPCYLLPRSVPELVRDAGLPSELLAPVAACEATHDSLRVLLAAGLDWDDVRVLAARGVRLRGGTFFAVPPTGGALAGLEPGVRQLMVQLTQVTACPVAVTLPMAVCLAGGVDAGTLARLVADDRPAYPARAVLAARALDDDEVGMSSSLDVLEAEQLVLAHSSRWPSPSSRYRPEHLVEDFAEAPVSREALEVALALMDRSVPSRAACWEPHLRFRDALSLAAALVGRPWVDAVIEKLPFGLAESDLLASVSDLVADAVQRGGHAPALALGFDDRGDPISVPVAGPVRRVSSVARARQSANSGVAAPGGREP